MSKRKFGASIAIIADTHMPKGNRGLSEECVEAISAADALIHAGDFIAPGVLAHLRAFCPTVHAVHGNVDHPALRRTLPETLEVELGPFRLGLIHDAGPAKGRPGSPTERRRAPRRSMGALTVRDSGLLFSHVWL